MSQQLHTGELKDGPTHVHKTRIDVQVGIDLDRRHRQPRRLEQQTATRGNNALSHTGNHT